MKMFIRGAVVATALLAGTSAGYAGCGIEGGSVRILSNDFPALHAVVAGAEECAGGGVTVTKNHTAEHNKLQGPALTANPAEYTSVVIANSSLVDLLNEGLVRPLDDLVADYGAGLKKSQLITIDGKIMAVAFMANTQHTFYRRDFLDQAGVGVPTTYEEILAAAKAIKDKGILEHPLSGTYKAGWQLGEEFVNMYLGYDGAFFKAGTAEVAINNEKGVAALNMMKSLSEYMNPDYLTYDTNALQADWEANRIAIANVWGSRSGAILDNEGGTAEMIANTKLIAAPTVGGGSTPATTLWWDGFTISKNISDEDAVASFRAMMNGISTKMANDNPGLAAWLIDGYTAGATAAGTVATAKAGAYPYPMLPQMGYLHTALGVELVDFMQGNESAQNALSDVEAAYSAAAKEAGYL